MARRSGGKIVTDGLVLALDGADITSFRGEPTENLTPNANINSYPTVGNTWGTYNVNQYNGNQYFSIGTISSVTNNIITTTTSHPLRTYDVVRPQTTGGGVTAGVNYFVKKISNTQFTLHQYNSSQDGTQGYINPSTGTFKVYDSIANDERISVNSTNFPTMWWGAPHLPNSGLVKELVTNGFKHPKTLQINDCIRLHYIRDDDVKDGMAYGVVPNNIVPNTELTVSFYIKATDSRAIGKTVQYYYYNYGANPVQTGAFNFTFDEVDVWKRHTFTFTPTNNNLTSYFFPQSGGKYSWEWSLFQIEQKPYATPFVIGTRGATVATGGGWADLSGNTNHGELVNGVGYDSGNGGSLTFDGVNDGVYISHNSKLNISSDFTIEGWVWWNQHKNYSSLLVKGPGGSGGLFNYSFFFYETYITVGFGNGTGYVNNSIGISNVPINKWHHILGTFDGFNLNFYINGNLINNVTTTAIPNQNSDNLNIIQTQYSIDGKVAIAKLYNRALTAEEISQNFNATRGRFGI